MQPGQAESGRKLGPAPVQGGASQGRPVVCSSLIHSSSLYQCVVWVRVPVPGEPAETKHTALPSRGSEGVSKVRERCDQIGPGRRGLRVSLSLP